LVEAETYDKGIAMGIIGDGWLRRIIVAFAVAVKVNAPYDFLAISVAVNRSLGTIAGNKQRLFVKSAAALRFLKTAAV